MSGYKESIDIDRLPKHIAIIMDGNGRWAKANGKPRLFGHMQGVESVRKITEAAAELGIKYLTIYAFSTENWNRPKEEVDGLMKILVSTIEKETETLNKNNVRLATIGDTGRLPEFAAKKLQECVDKTKSNTGTTLCIAISYSSRWEIKEMVKAISCDVRSGAVNAEDIDDELVSSYMATKGMPDPELLIRTSGEYRISNFLLWQLAYSELYFTSVMWPDFDKEEFYKAIVDFQKRERRFGMTGEQISGK